LEKQVQNEMQQKLTVDKVLERLLGTEYSGPSEDEMAEEMRK